MKRLTRGILVLFVTFTAGCAATYVLNRIYVRFELIAMGSVALPPAGRGGVSYYTASDGVDVMFQRLQFPSNEAAREAYQQFHTSSGKILQREPVFDREGKTVVGERLVGMFPYENGASWPSVICLDGRTIYEISSTSLRHALLFESRHRRY